MFPLIQLVNMSVAKSVPYRTLYTTIIVNKKCQDSLKKKKECSPPVTKACAKESKKNYCGPSISKFEEQSSDECCNKKCIEDCCGEKPHATDICDEKPKDICKAKSQDTCKAKSQDICKAKPQDTCKEKPQDKCKEQCPSTKCEEKKPKIKIPPGCGVEVAVDCLQKLQEIQKAWTEVAHESQKVLKMIEDQEKRDAECKKKKCDEFQEKRTCKQTPKQNDCSPPTSCPPPCPPPCPPSCPPTCCPPSCCPPPCCPPKSSSCGKWTALAYILGLAFLANIAYCIYCHQEDDKNDEEESEK